MKLSKTTLEILKNFNIINPSIFIKGGGNVISTISIADNVLANATVVEDFDDAFGVYDLGFFLNTISLFNDPDLDFGNEGYVKMTDSKTQASCEYKFADETVIKYPPNDSIELGDICLSFDISKDDMKALMKASSVMGLKDVKISKHNGKISLTIFEYKNSLSNSFRIELEDYTGDNEFELFFRVDNLKFVEGDYHVDITIDDNVNFAYFQNADIAVNYWVALEADSEFK